MGVDRILTWTYKDGSKMPIIEEIYPGKETNFEREGFADFTKTSLVSGCHHAKVLRDGPGFACAHCGNACEPISPRSIKEPNMIKEIADASQAFDLCQKLANFIGKQSKEIRDLENESANDANHGYDEMQERHCLEQALAAARDDIISLTTKLTKITLRHNETTKMSHEWRNKCQKVQAREFEIVAYAIARTQSETDPVCNADRKDAAKYIYEYEVNKEMKCDEINTRKTE